MILAKRPRSDDTMTQRRGSRQRPRPPGPRREGLRPPTNKLSDWLTNRKRTTTECATRHFGVQPGILDHHQHSALNVSGQTKAYVVETSEGWQYPPPVCNITKARPGRTQGGAAAIKSTIWRVTPKPPFADPSVLHHRNPWLGPNETHASDWMVALVRLSGIWDFLKNLLLHTSPRCCAQSDPNRCRKIVRSLTANSDREKSVNFVSRWRQDAKTLGVGEAGFTRMAITLQPNETITPKSVHPCMDSACGHMKGDLATGHLVAL